jgi:hypothetical protein
MARTGHKRNAHRVLVAKHEGKRPLGGPSLDGRTILKRGLKKYDGRASAKLQNIREEKDKHLGLDSDPTHDPLF